MATDAVQGAVASLRELVDKLKSSERFADQDAMVDLAEATAIGLSHLRAGAGQVQTNVEELEAKVKNELVQGVSARLMAGEAQVSGLAGSMALLDHKMSAIEQMVTGMSNAGWSIGGAGGGGGSNGRDKKRGVLEYKAIQFMKPLTGDKRLFRQWHQKFVSAVYTVQEEFGDILTKIAKELDMGAKPDEMQQMIRDEYDEELVDEISQSLYTILMDKSEGDAYDKIMGISNRDGLAGYGRIYRWFTEISGLGLAEQARRLMHPDAPKREDELAEFVDGWCERVRRLEAHGPKYVLAPLYKVTALRMMMVGRSKDHFEIWQDESGDDEAGFEKLLDRVKDYARRRKLDHTAEKRVSGGNDPMIEGATKMNGGEQGCQHHHGGDGGDGGDGGAQAMWNWLDAVMKGKGKGKSGFQGKCYACGEYGHSQNNCPHKKGSTKGGEAETKGKGKSGFQGSCWACGEYGHSQNNCPKAAGK